ncbi:glycine--tRNA ligase subunit beta [Vagococcus intermedius]|uniref:Glycine--tRNA ligase beta subunit n=1 Tax=Vagococcus intermedius TaxID=2991418 RepID=A0AAF0CW33_9ENTE|nr:glycine--tRNA ligase subunit beta [Vagococcus intermedius]WEG73946.1 glycine--tRNA ligase subunit beta [Vagococcus intermedius]WEG76026.1 glycine--tRNA ligase subunit beta [Vagococcus intermedius]
MAHNFLLEIGLEEMPAHVVTPSVIQLKEKTEKFLKENRLTFDSIEMFSTPRRLAIRINELADKQEDIEEEAKGPAKKIALDDEGNWSKAAQGFVRGQGLTPDDIFFKEIKGVEYVHVNKFVKGETAKTILAGMVDVIKSISFPVSMHWASYDFRYIRPIHWLVALLDDEVVPFELLDSKTGRCSRGHRFLGQEATIKSATTYESDLKEQFVLVDANERQELIVKQIVALEAKQNFKVTLDAELMEEVNNLVEYPTAFVGNFEAKYLDIPEEVLITSMKEHQRYFYVTDNDGKLLPHFVSVRNGNAEHIDNVIKGNEKVLTARLEDAEFFYRDDKELSIAECVEKLKQVTFHEKIGSIYEKMQRTGAVAQLLGQKLGLTVAELALLQRASDIYKFDLMTNMVGEFPELQGIMGEKYALMQGENPAVAKAIREHYLPVSSEGDLPVSMLGAILAVSDKIDSVMSFFNAGMIPSGSNDPYGLRRQTYGIVRIVAKMGWDFPLSEIQEEIATLINSDTTRFGIEVTVAPTQVIDFMKARMKQYLSTKKVRHDIIEAVINADSSNLTTMVEAATILKARHQEEDFKPSIEALTRTINLAAKGYDLLAADIEVAVEPSLFENDAEKALYDAVTKVEASIKTESLADNYDALKELYPLIEAYFEETMVMVEDEKVKNNRLRQLYRIARMVRSFASLDLLVVK